jgi:UDP-N-acetylmuramoylalanine--D-glutamate ligase
VIVADLAGAVGDAAVHAQPGDIVLLSPACSSFDMFRNYAERGKAFKSLVRAL